LVLPFFINISLLAQTKACSSSTPSATIDFPVLHGVGRYETEVYSTNHNLSHLKQAPSLELFNAFSNFSDQYMEVAIDGLAAVRFLKGTVSIESQFHGYQGFGFLKESDGMQKNNKRLSERALDR